MNVAQSHAKSSAITSFEHLFLTRRFDANTIVNDVDPESAPQPVRRNRHLTLACGGHQPVVDGILDERLNDEYR